jgi:protein-glucosylgalactosylhydroxylysine glucosidase
MLFDISIMRIKSVFLLLFLSLTAITGCRHYIKTDRLALVTRYNIENSGIDSLNSLSVGNGKFAFNVDITGLQTFPEFYSRGIALRTVSDFWKSNSCRFHLGMIGLKILKEDGKEISISDINDPVQKLNLWTGEIDSRFNIEGVPVHLYTVCHPDYDMVSVKIRSELIGKKRLKVKFSFPLGVSSTTGYDFNSPDKHSTRILSDTNNLVIFERIQDNEKYNVIIWCNDAKIREVARHTYYLEPVKADSVYSFSCQFLNDQGEGRVQNFGETELASKKNWEKFWTTCDVADFSECSDNGATELEKRLIISQYLSKINRGDSFTLSEKGFANTIRSQKLCLAVYCWYIVNSAL